MYIKRLELLQQSLVLCFHEFIEIEIYHFKFLSEGAQRRFKQVLFQGVLCVVIGKRPVYLIEKIHT